MADFETLQKSIQEVRAALRAKSREVTVTGAKARALDLRAREVARHHATDSAAARALVAERQQLGGLAALAVRDRDRLRADHAALIEQFLEFTDPREHVGKLADSTPFLLFPVRIETRFKIVPRGRATQHQLWVRVFPDECSIDTFDDVLSASEIARAQHYWASVWSAGKPASDALKPLVRDRRLTAWRKLMGSFNAGRAHWITKQYTPTNPDELPVRNATAELLPIIVSVGAPPASKDAICRYWEAVIRGAGKPADVALAVAALRTATGLGDEAAQALVKQHAPQELAAILEEGVPTGDVRVTFVAFDDGAAGKQSAWSQAAKVRAFPERFVLLGYQGTGPAAAPVVNEIGALIPDPLFVGPDSPDDVQALLKEAFGDAVDTMTDEEKAAKYIEHLAQHSDTRWLFDFNRAVELGLGFRVDLTPAQYRAGFTRLVVLGVQLSADATAGKGALEELLRHHQFGDAGFSLLAQGTATNNTEDAGSGFSIREAAEEAYDRYQSETDAPDALAGSAVDGRHLADALGVDPALAALRTARNYAGTDQAEARAMQTALWNATLGYYLESMVTAVADEDARRQLRGHFLDHVRGRGAVPSIRIGKQPYGILPITNLRGVHFPDRRPGRISATGEPRLTLASRESVLVAIFKAATVARADLQGVLAEVAHVGRGGDAHARLLRVLGLHPTSVEYDRRIAEGFAALRNMLNAYGFFEITTDQLRAAYRKNGLELLAHLGYQPPPDGTQTLPVFDRLWFSPQEDVKKPPIDDGPLSEERRLAPCTAGNQNYIQWLVDKARTDHTAIRDQSGFLPGKTPQAILFDLLCHSLNLEFGNTGLTLLARAKLISAAEARALRVDRDFIGIQEGAKEVESKWDLIYRKQPEIAPDKTIVAHISSLLAAASAADEVAELNEVVGALERLATLPTARLERCMAEHLDLCHYRLDAWLLSFVSAQLQAMRSNQETGGIYLGAYGWVEDLKPDPRKLEPVELDPEQQQAFDPQRAGGLVSDSSNAGYLHAPSTTHGITAAVLRNAYISTASKADPDRYKVNLSSERVRMALGVIEGIQQGQGLAELLGYQLERGLHDHNPLELDAFVYELRKVFPLTSNHLALTAIRKGRVAKSLAETTRFAEEEADLETGNAVTKIEARNVVNGLALLEHVGKPGNASYPFGFPIGTGVGELRLATGPQREAIDAEVDRLKNMRDAVADLAIAESVHQTVQGNFDRAAGALDAFSKGAFPQLPDVIQAPTSGLGITHRFGIHFPAGVSPDLGTTPRSKAEPGLNAWLKGLFPAAASVQCTVRFRPRPDLTSPPPAWSTFDVPLPELGLEPIDLLHVHDADSAKNLSALDDHVLRRFRTAAPRRLDLEIELDYVSAPPGMISFFQLGALLTQLRTLVIAARPLEASDLSLQSEGSKTRNATATIAPARIQKAKTLLDTGLAALTTQVIAPLALLVDLDDPTVGVTNLAAVLAAIDNLVGEFVEHLGPLSRFGLEGAGAAFVGERLRGLRAKLVELIGTRADRWKERSDRYQQIVDNEVAAAVTDQQAIDAWHRAETAISTTFTTGFANPAALAAAVAGKRAFFEQKRTAAATLLAAGFTSLAPLYADAAALVAGTETFDLEPLDLAEARKMVVVLAEDLLRQAQQLHARGAATATAVTALITKAAAAPAGSTGSLTEAAQAMFGEGFRVFPEFTLAADQVLELQRCLAGQAQLLKHQRDTVGTDEPTEDWLYSLARVRDKLAAWESTAVIAEGFTDRPPLGLTPFQLPYRDGDSWLGLAYPAEHVIEGDNLLYTAHALGFDPTGPVVGALVDEWTETIPSRQETTALTFHYDRPNCEAPQSLLLVTPAAGTGTWLWDDLVGALHEALEMARLRAFEPDLLDRTGYAKLLPATVATLTVHPVTMAINFALKKFLAPTP
jgi:hypothetical protein